MRVCNLAFGKCNILLRQIQVTARLNSLKIVKFVCGYQFVLIFAIGVDGLWMKVQCRLFINKQKPVCYDKGILQE